VIYCTGDLTLDGANSDQTPDLRGLIVAGGNCVLTNRVHAEIRYDPRLAVEPPPGFGKPGVETGPTEVKAYAVSGGSVMGITSNERWGQYFKPNLPAEATGWKVNSVDIWATREGSDTGNIDVGLYTPDGSNMPDTKVDEVSVPPTGFDWVAAWYNVAFSDHSGLSPNEGLCLTLTTNQPVASVQVWYQSSGVAEPDAAQLRGDATGWTSLESDKSLGYRIHATYTTGNGDIGIAPGSWRYVSN
jgi:hypothetical protein